MDENENRFFRRVFPFLGDSTSSWCFRGTYGLVAAGIVALIVSGFHTGLAAYFVAAAVLTAAGWAGQVFPLFPVGIVAFSGLFSFPFMLVHYGTWR